MFETQGQYTRANSSTVVTENECQSGHTSQTGSTYWDSGKGRRANWYAHFKFLHNGYSWCYVGMDANGGRPQRLRHNLRNREGIGKGHRQVLMY